MGRPSNNRRMEADHPAEVPNQGNTNTSQPNLLQSYGVYTGGGQRAYEGYEDHDSGRGVWDSSQLPSSIPTTEGWHEGTSYSTPTTEGWHEGTSYSTPTTGGWHEGTYSTPTTGGGHEDMRYSSMPTTEDMYENMHYSSMPTTEGVTSTFGAGNNAFSSFGTGFETRPEMAYTPDVVTGEREMGSMERQPRAIERRPLERYRGRYNTKVSRPRNDHNIIVETKVRGEELPSYESAVNLKDGVFTTTEAWGRRPLSDTEHGDGYIYDSDARKSGEPMSYSDVVYGQIAKVIEKYGKTYNISKVDEFEIQDFTIESIINKSILDAIGHLVEPGGYNEFPQHSTEFNKCMDTRFGKVLQHLLQQRYPAREVTSVVIDRTDDKPDASVEAIGSMSFIAERR
jgi:hypothetical protein